jgi:DNA-binding NtrC family response regulator
LSDDARQLLASYSWPGNVRELKNIAEQVSVLSKEQTVNATALSKFLPEKNFNRMPVLASGHNGSSQEFANEREILYKLFFDMKKDVTELKKMFVEILQNPSLAPAAANYTRESLLNEYHPSNGNDVQPVNNPLPVSYIPQPQPAHQPMIIGHEENIHHHEEVEESLNIMDKEKELILKALKKHKGKRKDAALDLGISERTLYRKLKEYDIND